MELFRVIKKDARAALRLFIGRSAASLGVVFLAYLAVNLTQSVLLFIFSGNESLDFYSLSKITPEVLFITAGCSILYFLVLPALSLGRTKLFLAFANGEDESLALMFDMFSSVKKFLGSFFFAVGYSLRIAVVFAFAAIPGSVLIYLVQTYMPKGTSTLEILKIAAFCVGIILFFLCFALGFIFIQRWSLAPYYRATGVGVHKSFVLSKKATKGLCAVIMNFKLSFLGWGVLSLLILPILWTAPYYLTANTIYAKYLMERYEHSLAQVPEGIETE